MLAAVAGPGGEVTVTEVAPPRADGRVLVRVAQAGVCGTDLKIADGRVPVRDHLVLGHELWGWVEAAPPGGPAPAGRSVLVNPAFYCGACGECRRDLPHLCRNGGLLGRDADGGFAELVAVDRRLLHPLPPSVRPGEAVLLQVLSTCVHAQSMVRAGPEDSAVVVGLGVTGLLHLQLLRARGVAAVVAVTRSAAKHELAARFGASVAVPPGEAADAVAEVTGGRGASVVIECAGTPQTLAQAMRLAGPGGTVVAFGITALEAAGLPTYDWYLKELTIRSPRAARPRDCDAAVALAAQRRVELAPLITARFPLAAADAALAAAAEPGQLKVVLDVAGTEPPGGAAGTEPPGGAAGTEPPGGAAGEERPCPN